MYSALFGYIITLIVKLNRGSYITTMAYTPAVGAGFFDDPRETPLDVNTLRYINKIHDTGFWPSVCASGLEALILGKEMQFETMEGTFNTASVSPAFREIVRHYWMPFITACMHEIMIAGIVVMEFQRAPNNTKVPVVLRSEDIGDTFHVTVLINNKTLQKEYRVYTLVDETTGMRSTKPTRRRRAFVLSGFGGDPGSHGTIRSRLVPLINWETYYARLMQFDFVAQYTLARPPLVIETPEDKTASTNIAEYTGVYSEYDPETARRAGQGLFTRQTGAPEREEFEEKVTGSSKDKKDFWLPETLDFLEFETQWRNNTLPLPPGNQVANAPLPVRDAQWESKIRMYQDSVSAIFFIPRSHLIQDTSNRGQGNAILTRERLRHTAAYWTVLLSRILTDVYRELYLKHDWVFRFRQIPKTPTGQRLTDMFKAARNAAQVTVTLPMPPTIEIEHMRQLYLMRIMDWKELHNGARSASGLAPADPPPEPPYEQIARVEGVDTDEGEDGPTEKKATRGVAKELKKTSGGA